MKLTTELLCIDHNKSGIRPISYMYRVNNHALSFINLLWHVYDHLKVYVFLLVIEVLVSGMMGRCKYFLLVNM